MKQTCIISMLALLVSPSLAQSPVIKAYAYSRITIPGIRPEVVNEKEPPTKQIHTPFPPTFYLYLEIKRRATIHVDGLWLKQRFYKVSFKKVKTPVLLSKQEGMAGKQLKETLVAKTTNDVYKVQLGAETNRKTTVPAELEQSQNNEVIFVVSSNRKIYYAPVNKIKELQPIAAK